MIKYKLVDESKGEPNVNRYQNVYEFLFPCRNSSDCTDYELTLPPGLYRFEAYGASGGIPPNMIGSTIIDPKTNACNDDEVRKYRGNSVCNLNMHTSGAGGYISSTLYLDRATKAYLMNGGQGTYPAIGSPDWNYIPGGYGGGGYGMQHRHDTYWGASGGGRTALMMIEDDIFHSVLVSGSGGGSDDYNLIPNDGRGGAGGGLIGQGYWINNKYYPDSETNESHFFTYGSGESIKIGTSSHPQGSRSKVLSSSDFCGAGAGWYGGFASFYDGAGCAGGTSFALTSNATIPEEMTVHDTFYSNPVNSKYAFSRNSAYLMHNVIHARGIWIGNGMLRITYKSKSLFEICQTFAVNLCMSNILLKTPMVLLISS